MTKEHCFFRQAAVEISEAATEPTLQCLLREAHRGGALSTDFQVPIPMSDTPLHVHHFDTDSLEQKDRFRYWADRFSRSVGYAGLESPNRDDFHQHLSILEVPGVARFQRQQGSGIAVRSEPGQVQGVETYPFYLMLKLGNGATTVAQGREALIETGDMVLLDASRGMRMRAHEAVNSLVIGLSAPLVQRWLPGAHDSVALRLDGAKGWAGVLSAYLRSLDIHQMEGIERPLERALIGEHILSMLSFTLEQRGLMSGGETVSSRDHLLHGRMRSWIRDNYSNPAVSASMLANDFNVSVRYVHKVFSIAGRGVTFRDALQCERLDAALRMLRTAANSNTYMAQIAYRCGFADAAYFGLVFRKVFGCTPRAYGRRLLGVGPEDDEMSAAEVS
jgi:AraC-like DNA-binding protein